jgi:Bacterial Ig-like domain
MRRARLLSLAAAPAALLSAAAVWAYLTTTASGAAPGSVGTLSVPTSVAASTTAGSGTVSVTWHAAALSNGTAPTGYYVQRFAASTPSAACASSASALLAGTAVSCNDTAVADGTYTYRVTAVYRTWTATSSASNSVTVVNDATAPAVSASISPAPNGLGYNGTSVTVQISATDSSGVASITYSASGAQTIATTTVSNSGNVSPFTANVPISNEGHTQVSFTATDRAGNTSAAQTTDVYIDKTNPTPGSFSLAAAVNRTVTLSNAATDAAVNGFASGVASVAYYFCAGTCTPTQSSTLIGSSSTAPSYTVAWSSQPADGTYSVAALVTDNVGHTAFSAPATTRVDNTAPAAPVISVATNPVNSTTQTAASISGTSESGAAIALTVSDGTHTVSGSTTASGTSWSITGINLSTLNDGSFSYSVKATDAAGNTGLAATLTASKDTVAPGAAITSAPTINSSNVTSVSASGTVEAGASVSVAITDSVHNTAPAAATVSGTTWSVSGINASALNDGTVTYRVTATDAAGNQGTVTQNASKDTSAPTVTINQAATQADPSNASTINFTVVFSESVTGFSGSGVALSGTAGATTATVSGTGATYNVAVTGMTGGGTVIASVGAGKAQDSAGNANVASTSTDNTVTYDMTAPTVTVNQASTQVDPTNGSSIAFTVVFSEAVTGFDGSDVTLGGTAGATTATVSGTGPTYTVAVSGMTGSGTVTASIAANRATDAAGNGNTASTSTDNTVTYDVTAPTVTVNQASTQVDPTNGSSISFTVVFSEAVTGFDSSDVTLGGTAGATTATVSGTGPTYTVAVTGMTGSGTVTASIAANRATDAAGNGNTASTSTDNTVTYDVTAPQVTALASFQSDGVTAGNGKMEAGDKLQITFSEALKASSVPTSSITVTLHKSGSGNALLTIAGTSLNITVDSDTGSTGYFSSSGTRSASFTGGSAALSSGNTVLTVTVGSTFSGDTLAASSGTLVFVPASTITDVAGNSATGKTVTSFKLF